MQFSAPRGLAKGLLLGFVGVVLVTLMLHCSKQTTSPRAAASAQSLDWREDPAFTQGQRELLGELEAETQGNDGDFYVESWFRAGTARRINLSVQSGAGPGASIEDHARSFQTETAG